MELLKHHAPHFVETVEDLLRRGHAVRFHADGWSMHPTIRCGETIVVEPIGNAPVRTGDVLLYRNGHAVIAHRLVLIAESSDGRSSLTLRGDAADSCDAPIVMGQVLGRVVAVERRGRIVTLGQLKGIYSPVLARMLRRARLARARVAERIAL
jgi:hypothetical protein